MPAFEITRIVRAAGFDPLAPPLREGTTYVLRATDFRGILMRVVVDARSGAIRAVNRIVPGPGPYGQIGMVTPPYGVAPVYPPPNIAGPEMMPDEEISVPPMPPALPVTAIHPGTHPFVAGPPLPRPRPAEFASRKTVDDAKPGTKADAQPSVAPASRSDVKSGTAVSGPAAAPAAPSKSPSAPAPLND